MSTLTQRIRRKRIAVLQRQLTEHDRQQAQEARNKTMWAWLSHPKESDDVPPKDTAPDA